MDFYESETVELKSEIVSDICTEIIAFANTHGGTLYIGVQDNGEVVGVPDTDKAILRLSNMVRDSIKPDVTMFVHYEAQTVEGKQVVAVTIQKGTDRPYYLASKGLKPSGVYVRNGTSTDPSTDTAIRRMIKETDGDSFESMRSLEQELTFQAAEGQFQKCGVAFGPAQMKTLGLISQDDVYSNVGLLLSDQCPSVVKAATFAGTERDEFQDRREFGGSLFQQMEELYAYLDLRNRTGSTFQGLYRIDTRDYPEEALREALLNSIVHRDYSYSASTLVSVYADRMEFVSIGGLPDGVELEDVMLGLSVCRNPKLAAVFYRLKLIEAYGTGMPKIMKAYKGASRQPKIEATNNAFKITLPNRNAEPALVSMPEGPEGKILAYLSDHDSLVRSDVDTLLGISQSTANRILKHMVIDGLIYKEGNGRRTVYRKTE
jgi:ATP-dependent DNA helicase RecG